MEFEPTPAQTIGPFFAVMLPLGSNRLVDESTPGAITISGRVFDGSGEPVADALLEMWQADATGEYPSGSYGETAFPGFGRCATGPGGEFSFVTVKPGPVPGHDERRQAPHMTVTIFARGLLNRLVTRIYFPDEVHANERDPLLQSIDDPATRATLIAEPTGPASYRFDIRLQGEGETAFLAI